MAASAELSHAGVWPPSMKWYGRPSHLLLRFNSRASEGDKIGRAYQLQEDLEKEAQTLGHSILTRGRELVAMQD